MTVDHVAVDFAAGVTGGSGVKLAGTLADSTVAGAPGSRTAKVRNLVISAVATSVECFDLNGGTATMSVDYANFAGGSVTSCTGGATLGHVTNLAPGFLSTSDFHLAPDSLLVDLGDPAAAVSATDVDGQSRFTDGNGDGAARRDLGADETVAVAPPITAPAPPTEPAPAPPVPVSDALPVATGQGMAPTALDTLAPVVDALRVRRLGRTLRLRLSEAALVSITIQRRSATQRSGSTGTRRRSMRFRMSRV